MSIQIKILLFINLISVNLIAQESPFKLPELAVPSPQSFELTKYGDILIDESSGKISPSIPIHEFKAGDISVPFNLSYYGGGVKVSQTPTWTGINWTLNAGGVITRIVKDLPDETNKGRYFYSYEDLEGIKYWADGGPPLGYAYYFPQNIISLVNQPEEYDTQVDEFSFSFPGYSGSFFLVEDEQGNFTAKLTKYQSELRIEILGNFHINSNFEFKITTTDGTKYFFGGLVDAPGATETGYAFEETQLIDRSQRQPVFGMRAKTAFYLTKIENFKNDVVYFEYFTKPEYNQLFLKDQKLISLIYQTTDPCTGDDGIENNLNSFESIQKNTVYNGKFLKRIWSPQSSSQVNFNSYEVFETLQGGGRI